MAQVEAELPAHSGGVVALDIRGDLVATAGFGMRHGQLVMEQFVKVRLTPNSAGLSTPCVPSAISRTAHQLRMLHLMLQTAALCCCCQLGGMRCILP